MDTRTIEKRFLLINIKLGLLTGVWPYQKKTPRKWIRRFVLCLVSSCYFTQYARIVVSHSMNVLLDDYPYLLATFGTTLKFGNYLINDAKLKSLLRGIYTDWMAINPQDEHAIMAKYGRRGYLIALLYLLHVSFCVCVFVSIPFASPILDVIKPLNVSRKKLFVYPAHYFIDEEKFYYPIILHMILSIIVCGSVYCACDANYVYAVQHACGLLAISGYRFKHACNSCGEPNKSDAKKLAKLTHKNVCKSIQGHQRALQYVKEIETTHDTCLFISVGMLMLSISLLLLRVSEGEHTAEWCADVTLLMVQLLHMLFLTIQGQFLINSYDTAYNTMCEALWYNSGCKTQVLYVLALRRSLNPPLLTAGGFVTLNLKTFAEIVKASVSYYTVMQSK